MDEIISNRKRTAVYKFFTNFSAIQQIMILVEIGVLADSWNEYPNHSMIINLVDTSLDSKLDLFEKVIDYKIKIKDEY